ncbi:MAG TPA: hypothetical protein VIJ75_10405 [Hanamia sp.]
MKSAKKIKKEIHEYIDLIKDDETLWMVREDVVEYLKKEKTKMKDEVEEALSEEEISEINTGLKEIENGETVGWDEYLKATSRWHTK